MQRRNNRALLFSLRMPRNSSPRWFFAACGFMVLAAVSAAAQSPQHIAALSAAAAPSPSGARVPDSGVNAAASQPALPPAGSAPRQLSEQEELAQESARLVVLAKQLKAEVDSSRMDILSVQLIRTAQSIEKLAQGVKNKIKTAPGAK